MKRLLALGGLVTAAVLAPATAAHATPYCVTHDNVTIVCVPDLGELAEYLEHNPEKICVTYGTTTVICLF